MKTTKKVAAKIAAFALALALSIFTTSCSTDNQVFTTMAENKPIPKAVVVMENTSNSKLVVVAPREHVPSNYETWSVTDDLLEANLADIPTPLDSSNDDVLSMVLPEIAVPDKVAENDRKTIEDLMKKVAEVEASAKKAHEQAVDFAAKAAESERLRLESEDSLKKLRLLEKEFELAEKTNDKKTSQPAVPEGKIAQKLFESDTEKARLRKELYELKIKLSSLSQFKSEAKYAKEELATREEQLAASEARKKELYAENQNLLKRIPSKSEGVVVQKSNDSEEKGALFFTPNPSYSIEPGKEFGDEEFVVGSFSVSSDTNEKLGDFEGLGTVSASKSGRFTIRDPNFSADEGLIASYEVSTLQLGGGSSSSAKTLAIPAETRPVLGATKKWLLTFTPDNIVAGDKVTTTISLVGALTKNGTAPLVATESSQWSLESQLMPTVTVAKTASIVVPQVEAWWENTVLVIVCILAVVLTSMVIIIYVMNSQQKKDRQETDADPSHKTRLRRSRSHDRKLADSIQIKPVGVPNIGAKNPFTIVRDHYPAVGNNDDMGEIDGPMPPDTVNSKNKCTIPPPRDENLPPAERDLLHPRRNKFGMW